MVDTANKRTRAEIQDDRAFIWDLRIRGYTYREIHVEVNRRKAPGHELSYQQIAYDTKAVENEVVKRAETNASLHRERATARLEYVIHEADRGWRNSLLERRKTRTRQRSTPAKANKEQQALAVAATTLNEATVESEQSVGDARFLAVLLRAIEQLVTLQGLTDAQRGPDVPDEPVREIVIRRDPALEPGNTDMADDEDLPRTVEGEFTERDDDDEDLIVSEPPGRRIAPLRPL